MSNQAYKKGKIQWPFFRPNLQIDRDMRSQFGRKKMRWAHALLLCLFLFPLGVVAQIGTNPSNPYGGSQPGDPNYDPYGQGNGQYNGPYNQGPNQLNRKKIKGDSAVLKNVFYSWNVKMITEKNLRTDSLTLLPLDTSLHNFENYSKLYQPGSYQINLGNLGLAAMPLLPDFHVSTGFHNGQTTFDIYLRRPEQILYFRNKSPFTDVFYITGKGKKPSFSEGIFHFVHARNINPRLNVGIEYTRSGSNGYYARQTADVLNFDAFLWYQSQSLRYNLVSNLIVNSISADENGGLQNDSVFSKPTSLEHPYEPVYLNGAKSRRNDVGLYLKQYYLIGRIDTIRDSVTNQIKVFPTARAYYSFYAKNSTYQYIDNYTPSNTSAGQLTLLGRAFYPNIFLDTLRTRDKTTQNEVVNEFGLSLFGRGNLQNDKRFSTSGIRLDASIKDELIMYKQNMHIDSTLNNVILHANAGYDLSNRFSVRVDGDYVLIGPNHLDNYLAANAFFNFGPSLGLLKMSASLQTSSPPLAYNRWISNSYSWNFHFDKTQTKTLAASYENQRFKFKAFGEYSLINNYLYFSGIANQVVFPTQFEPEIQFLKLGVEKDFAFGNWTFHAQAVYQKNSAPFIVRTPDFYGMGSVAYQYLFFKVLRVKAGIEATYFSKAYLYDYAPGLQQFFVYSSKQYGNYPIANIFLVAGLKRVNFILRYDYVNQLLDGKKGYYTINHYPMPDALFKFGLSWKFYD